MGNPKQKWTAAEEEALRAGVAKHGAGKWKNIQRDPQFNQFLHSRSNIDLKDKWRNLSIASGQGSRDRSKTQKEKANPDAPATPLPKQLALPSSAPLPSPAPVSQNVSREIVMEDSSKCLLDVKTASNYNVMIFEALATLREPNGSDTSTIANFIEQRHEVPQNFRKLLGARLRRLVAQDKLEKVQNCYKIKKDVSVAEKTSAPKQKEIQPRQALTIGYLGNTLEEAAATAAEMIAEADYLSFKAAEKVKEAERVAKLAEDTDSFLEFAKEIFKKCSQGEIVLLA